MTISRVVTNHHRIALVTDPGGEYPPL